MPTREPPGISGGPSQTPTSSSSTIQASPPIAIEEVSQRRIDREDTSNSLALGLYNVQGGHSPFHSGSPGSLLARDRSPSDAAKLDRTKDPQGLTIIYEPNTPPYLDIIFVHGLGGSSLATWCHNHDPEFFWPYQWLPHEPGIQGARISSFGYDSNFGSTRPSPVSGVGDFAKSLLQSLKFAKDGNLEEANIGEVNIPPYQGQRCN